MESYNETEIDEKFDAFCENLLEFYKDGKYSYFTFKESNPGEPQPGKNRSAKSTIKKIIKELLAWDKDDPDTDPRVKDIIHSMLEHVYQNDDINRQRLFKRISILKKQNSDLKEEIQLHETFEASAIKDMEDDYKKQLMKEAVTTSQGEELERWKNRNKILSHKLASSDNKLEQLRASHATKIDELNLQISENYSQMQLLIKNNKRGSATARSGSDKYKKKYLKLKIKYDKLLKEQQSSDEETSSDEED